MTYTLKILRSAIEAAIKRLKADKATGTDEIPGELLQQGGECIVNQYHRICNDIWRRESIPEEWSKSIILTLPKEGDITRCENHRINILINHGSKVLLEVIRNRMKPYAEAVFNNRGTDRV